MNWWHYLLIYYILSTLLFLFLLYREWFKDDVTYGWLVLMLLFGWPLVIPLLVISSDVWDKPVYKQAPKEEYITITKSEYARLLHNKRFSGKMDNITGEKK